MDQTKDNIRTLVMLYEQYPCLYVVKSADYYNRMKRDRALQLICDQYEDITKLPVTPEMVKKKINNLRSQYLDQLNKIKKSKSSGASADDVHKPLWWLFDELSFLDPHIGQRKGESSITILNHSAEVSDNEELQYVDVQNCLKSRNDEKDNIRGNVSSTPSSSRSNTSYGIAPPSRKRRSDVSSSSTDGKKDFWAMASHTLQTIKSEEEEDGIRYWILYLESELRKIKDPKKLKRLQKQIICLVDAEDSE